MLRNEMYKAVVHVDRAYPASHSLDIDIRLGLG
jgi:hypothetical protein